MVIKALIWVWFLSIKVSPAAWFNSWLWSAARLVALMRRILAKSTAAACFACGVFTAGSVKKLRSSGVKSCWALPSILAVHKASVRGFSRTDLVSTK